jgi:hypothetical protein
MLERWIKLSALTLTALAVYGSATLVAQNQPKSEAGEKIAQACDDPVNDLSSCRSS